MAFAARPNGILSSLKVRAMLAQDKKAKAAQLKYADCLAKGGKRCERHKKDAEKHALKASDKAALLQTAREKKGTLTPEMVKEIERITGAAATQTFSPTTPGVLDASAPGPSQLDISAIEVEESSSVPYYVAAGLALLAAAGGVFWYASRD